jgi:Transposase DDE domain group 1
VSKRSGFYPRSRVDVGGAGVVSHAGGVLVTAVIGRVGLDEALSRALAPWRRPQAVHDPAKVVLDLAVTLALGGDCLADIALVRSAPGVFGPVASDPTVSRTIDALAADAPAALAAIDSARAMARARAWQLAGAHAPDHDVDAGNPLIIDVDATLVTAHSEKEQAAPTFKKGFGFHPLWTFADHGSEGTGEPMSVLLRKGNAGSNTAVDHISVVRAALRQLPSHRPGRRPGRQVLVRADAGGCTHAFVDWLVGQRLQYSIGFTLPVDFAQTLEHVPEQVWTPAYDGGGRLREAAHVAEVTDLLDLRSWPAGMRVIVRRERPHPGAQLRITDANGWRITAFATNTRPGGPRSQLPELELRHRRRARAEDRIRSAKDTGLTNLPLHDFAQNQIWCAIVALACELLAWLQMLALTGSNARRWEHKRLRLRLLTIPARLVRGARRTRLRLATTPWTAVARTAWNRLVPG